MKSPAARQALLDGGFTATVMAYFCSQCGLRAESQPRERLHPMKAEVDRLKMVRDRNPRHSRLWDAYNDKYHQTQRLMFNRSFCCGVRFEARRIDMYQEYYDRWQRRSVITDDRVNGEPIAHVQNLRHSYGPGARDRDDDFIVCHYLFGVDDAHTEWLLRAFAFEDDYLASENQVLPSPVPATARQDQLVTTAVIMEV